MNNYTPHYSNSYELYSNFTFHKGERRKETTEQSVRDWIGYGLEKLSYDFLIQLRERALLRVKVINVKIAIVEFRINLITDFGKRKDYKITRKAYLKQLRKRLSKLSACKLMLLNYWTATV